MHGERTADERAADPLPVLPVLLDAKTLQTELGVTRAGAEAIMRQVPSVVIPGVPLEQRLDAETATVALAQPR